MSACSTLFYTCSTCSTCSTVAPDEQDQSNQAAPPIQSITVWLPAPVSQNTFLPIWRKQGLGEIGLWAPLQISSSRETASGRATHGPSTQTFNIVLDLSTGKLDPIIHVAEVNKIIFIGASILFGRPRYLIKLLVN